MHFFQCDLPGREACGQLTSADAFRHCFGSGLMALRLGASFAEKITDRYEAYAGNDPDEKAYDLSNNERGINYAKGIDAGPDEEAQLHSLCSENPKE